MSEHLRYGTTSLGAGVLVLPFDPRACVLAWHALGREMLRHPLPAFTRDEWAYLVSFLDERHLGEIYVANFGEPSAQPPERCAWLARPRGRIALWLPNNVSLLGPLLVVLVSLAGCPVRIKGGTRGADLMSAFLDYAREHVPDGPLKRYLHQQVELDFFDHSDPRHARMAAEAAVRIVFGSVVAATAIEALPHPPDSTGVAFIDRQSEAWIEPKALTIQLLDTLVKVFSIYGQAGCTSPRRVVLLDASTTELSAFRERLALRWGETSPGEPEAYVASNNVMARQLAAALGWDAMCTPANRSVLAVGDTSLPLLDEPMTLHLVSATLEEAVAALPQNVQTLGYAFAGRVRQDFVGAIARSRIKRAVPLAEMHHFGPIWDGQEFWRQLFEIVEFRSQAEEGPR